MNPIYYIIVVAISGGFLGFFHNRSSLYINPAFGGILISLIAVIVGSIIFANTENNIEFLKVNSTGLMFIFGAGICAFAIDFFSIKAYSMNLPITTGAPITIIGSVLVASMLGFFLGEKITILKIISILILLIGSIILTSS